MIFRMVALSLATVVALAGCTGGKGDGGDGDAVAKPPAGGWPQPEEGMLTPKMCGLLVEADYKSVGHKTYGPLEAVKEKQSSNYVSCVGDMGEWLTLDLQPTAESAKVSYDRGLESRKSSAIIEKQETILAQDLLQGADQSWFDYGPAPTGSTPGDYQLHFRRGALVAWIQLNPAPGDSVSDPKAAVQRLAGLVLERLPEVGKTDGGTTPKVRFEVKGTGQASAISYITQDHRSVTLKDVQLPWSLELAMSDHGDNEVHFNLSANTRIPGMPTAVTCSISIRGTLVKQESELSFAICDAWAKAR